jgi:hypothetical protein
MNKNEGYGFLVAFGAGLVAGLADGLVAGLADGLVAGLADGLVAGLADDFVAGLADDFVAGFMAPPLVAGAGLAANAGTVMRNAAAINDAMVFFMEGTSFRSKIRERLTAYERRLLCSVTS